MVNLLRKLCLGKNQNDQIFARVLQDDFSNFKCRHLLSLFGLQPYQKGGFCNDLRRISDRRWLREKPLNKQASSQKLLLVLILDTSLTFDERMEAVTSLVNRTISLVKKIITYHLSSLTKTYKSFLRSQLDFGDVIFGEAYNISFHQRLLYLQNKTLLTITDAMNGSSIQKLYRELGLGFQKKTMVSKLRFLQECWKTVPK